MQIQDDGTHAILPARRCPKGRRDRAKLPVTWLRQTDGKLRRNGYAAAIVQPRHAVAERGKLHGALGLLAVNELQIRLRCRRVFDDEDGEHRWRKRRRRSWQRGRTPGRLKRQDKSGSPVDQQAIDIACVQRCRSVAARAAFAVFACQISALHGTHRSIANPSVCERVFSFSSLKDRTEREAQSSNGASCDDDRALTRSRSVRERLSEIVD